MTQLPLVSIIVPIYNMERFLDETLQSIAATRYEPLEVILVDDGSKDNSAQIAQSFVEKDARFKLVSQENAGVSHARNQGIEKARGKYILPVDADNLIEPTFVERAVTAFESGGDDVVVVRPRIAFFGDKTGEWEFAPFSLKHMAQRNIIDNCALFKKSDWQRVGGYCETIKTREDWDFWLMMLEDGGRVITLDTIELHYRIRPDAKHKQYSLHRSNVIPIINQRHPELMEWAIGGPLLRHRRSLSPLVNTVRNVFRPKRVVLDDAHQEFKYFARALATSIHSHRAQAMASSQYRVSFRGHTYLITAFEDDRKWYPFAKSRAAHAAKQHQAIGYMNQYAGWMLRASYLIEEYT